MNASFKKSSRLLLLPVFALGIGAFIVGCASFKLETAYDYQGHYILIHKDGIAIQAPTREEAAGKPSGSLNTDRTLFSQDLEAQLERTIKDRITAYATASNRQQGGKCAERLHLLVIVHGGMNSYAISSTHLTGLMTPPLSPPQEPVGTYGDQSGLLNNTCYYPLFINWNSDFGDSISDDLFRFRFGERNNVLVWSTLLPTIVSRVLNSAMDIPVALFHQGVTMKDGIIGAWDEGDPPAGIAGDTLINLPAYSLSMALLPFTQGFGAPAWGIMKRRVDEATGAVATTVKTRPVGAARTLIEALRKWIEVRKDAAGQDQSYLRGTSTQVTVTLVGHSMGALVINRLLQTVDDPSFPPGSPPLPVDRVIYLAPASSINETEQMLMPYLDRHLGTHFWLFTLNRRDESREIPLNGWAIFVPRGTLLAWIDTFLENEAGPGEGRFGWVKYLEAYYGLSGEAPEARGFFEYLFLAEDPWRDLGVKWSLKTNPSRLHAYASRRRVFDHSLPEYHSDFLEAEHFKKVLCKVDPTMFTSAEACVTTGGEE